MSDSVEYSFTTQSANNTSETFQPGGIVKSHSIQLNVTGSPATATYNINGSLDGVNWFSLSGNIDASTSTFISIADKPAKYIQGVLSALTGGTAPTVTFKYAGIRD